MRTASTPLSSLHAMLPKIERQRDAHIINRMVNDASILPAVKGYDSGRLDLSAPAQNPANVFLAGEHGYILFVQVAPNIFEAHTSALPEGRGAWVVGFVNAAMHWLFTRTLAIEIFTRVPNGNKPALGLVRAIHGRYEFERKNGWVVDMDPVPCGIYSRSIVDWMRDAPGLAERGGWFHDRLEEEYAKLGRKEPSHDEDATHDRYVGAAVEMILGGQPDKGIIFYNRWALMAGYQPVSIVAREPLTINIRDALIIVRDDDFWVASLLGK